MVAIKLRKVMVDKFDSCSLQWSRWKEQFELQMLANEVGEDYWVKVASFNLDEPSYRSYKHWSGKITGNQNIAWPEFSDLMERHYQKRGGERLTIISREGTHVTEVETQVPALVATMTTMMMGCQNSKLRSAGLPDARKRSLRQNWPRARSP